MTDAADSRGDDESAADRAARATAAAPGPALRVGRITVYPIKSLDGVDLDAAAVLPGGALAWDRRFALFSPTGEVVNGKREPRVHRVAAAFDLSSECVTVGPRAPIQPDGSGGSPGAGSQTFSLSDDREELEARLSRLLARPVQLREDGRTGFPDDADAPGPTVVTAATLAAVAAWFGLTAEEVRRRFRANLELTAQGTGTAEVFAEDRLVPEEGEEIEFWAGEGRFVGVGPCARCVVPARDSRTGELLKGFQKEFADRRRRMLPAFAPVSRFDHFFRLTVNTRPLGRSRGGGNGGIVRVGDAVRIIGPRPALEAEGAGGAGKRVGGANGTTRRTGARRRSRR